MSYMFSSLSNLSNLDVSNWDTSNVKITSYMFYGCLNLSMIDVSSWDTGNIENMSYMFYSASVLNNLDVSGWDTSNVTDMNNMFGYTDSLGSLSISNWDTGKVRNMNHMFVAAKSLVSLDLSQWDIRKVTNIGGMFASATSLENLDVSGWDTTHRPFMNALFSRTKLSQLTVGSKSLFNSLANLPAIPTSDGEYTGAWERITPVLPEKIYLSSQEFMTEYDGSMSGTYIWQKTEDLTGISVKDLNLYIGSSWTAGDNFISATDKDGNLIGLSGVVVAGTVDTNTPGSYEVTYSYGGMTKTAMITILEDQTSINGKDSTIYTGTTWSPADNFVSAVNREGVTVDFSQVTVTGTVDTSVPGEYDVTYHYTDPVTGKQVETTVTVTVVQDQATLVVKDSTIYTGTTWTPEDNFISATDKDGIPVDFSQVTVTGTVDPNTPGVYEVTYSYEDQSITITITVLVSQATLVVKDLTIYVGTPWTAEENFVSATDKEGNLIEFSQLLVSGIVDIMTPGKYKVIYTYLPSTRIEADVLTETAIITILDKRNIAPVLPVKPMTPEKPTMSLDLLKPAGIKDSEGSLPKAGEQRLETILLSLLGVGIAVGAGYFIGFGRRRKYKSR